MEMKPLSDFIPQVMNVLREANVSRVQEALVDTAIDICKRTRLWKEYVYEDENCTKLQVLPEGARAEILPLVAMDIDGDLIKLIGIPHCDEPIAIIIRVPERTACELPAVLYSKWLEVITDGALARVFEGMLDLNTSIYYQRKYGDGLNTIIYDTLTKDKTGHARIVAR